MKTKFNPFLWPDHVIGKRESRRIREEQNALYNSYAELFDALVLTVNQLELMCPARDGNLRKVLAPCFDQAKAAIAKATGETA